MLPCNSFFRTLQEENICFFTGVPDSLLKSICAYISDNTEAYNNIIAANEGAALALAAGHYLATGNLGLVYLQNSGLGNLVNPLTSLTDPEVYSIPALLLIGWRGEPEVHDEPQHRKQGRVMLKMLESMEIDYAILPEDSEAAQAIAKNAVATARANQRPFALIVRKGTFEAYKLQNKVADRYTLSREDALKLVMDSLTSNEIFISTTGMTSREVFEHREAKEQGHSRDFLTVGCMGHASQIALGIALAKPDRPVYCLDGDGAVIMHMGSLAIIGDSDCKNFHHIVVNNAAYDSVGGQPSVGFKIDIPAVAKSCGYRWIRSVSSEDEIKEALATLKTTDGPSLLEIRVNKGARADLGRPTTTPIENKQAFMEYLKN